MKNLIEGEPKEIADLSSTKQEIQQLCRNKELCDASLLLIYSNEESALAESQRRVASARI